MKRSIQEEGSWSIGSMATREKGMRRRWKAKPVSMVTSYDTGAVDLRSRLVCIDTKF